MIISHELELIFVKTRKTAGTSIEIGLSKYAGPKDVITAISPEDEALRHQVGGHGPQNDRLPVSLMGRAELSTLVRTRAWPKYQNHDPASRMKAGIGDAS